MTIQRIEQLSEAQVKDLHSMYQVEWWTKGRRLADVRHMLAHSDIIVAFCNPETERLIAFARVLTDYVYKALILDVIVVPARRNRGLGRVVMDTILDHPALGSVQNFELYCLPEMEPFYQKWDFTAELGELRFMRLTR